MDLSSITWLVLGLIVLTIGAEALVRGASRLAAAAKISPLVIGLTVVAFGTSAPELAVSVRSALTGQPDLALGNVVGSNIFNVLFILGIAAVITPLSVSVQLIRVDVPIMVGVSFALLAIANEDGRVSRIEGAFLFAGLIAYIVLAVVLGRREANLKAAPEFSTEYGKPEIGAVRLAVDGVLVIAGLTALVLGADWFVSGASAIARSLGMSELVIGLTIVAAGTSMPEVAASIVAAIKGERDIAVGNVVGSNIFNILGVLGSSAAIAPQGLTVAPVALAFDIPVMTAVAVACLPIFLKHSIARWEGFVFLAYYVAYTVYLVLAAKQHAALPAFSSTMLYYALPITALTLFVTTARALRAKR